MRRETLAFAQQKWPGGYLYHYGLCELAQRQAVLLRQDAPSDRAIKSDRAKVVMTAGCISKNYGIINYTCREKEITRQIRIYKPAFNVSRETDKNEIPPPNFEGGISVYWTNICRKLSFYYRCDTS